MGKIDFSGLDLQTQQGLDEARKRLTEYARANALSELSQKLLDAEISESSRIQTIGNLLNDLNLFSDSLKRPHPKVIHWDDIEVLDREWLIPNWLPANTVTLFTGQGGTGKSWLTLQLVCQIACNFDGIFLDTEHETPKKADYDDSEFSKPKHIIFATYEDEPAEIKRRLQALASSFNWISDSLETIKKYLHIVDMRGVGSVWGPGMGNHIANTGDLLPAGEEIQQICEKKKARLLVMDPLSGAFGGNENDRTAVYDFVSAFRGWGDEQNCAMLIVGHLPKSSEGRASGFSGSTAWEASVRSMWMLSKVEHIEKNEDLKYYYALQHTKSNYGRLQKEVLLAKNQYGWWSKVENVDEAKEAYKKYYDAQEESDAETDIPDF